MSPRLLICAALILAGIPSLRAQFSFDKLKDAVKASDSTGKASEAVGYAEDGSKVAKGIAGISIDEEKEIGESVALAVIGKYGGLVRDDAVVTRVNLVGRGLATYSSRPDLGWTFGVLNSDTVNAFSAPGGYVFITRGLYDTLATDDALAGVLGHEIAHVTGKHALNILRRGEAMSGALSFLKKRSNDLRQAESVAQKFDVGVNDILGAIFEKGFDPNTEYAADKSGRDLALTTGYAPGALRATLATLQARGGAPKTMFSTHPPFAERIKRLPDERSVSAAVIVTPANPAAADNAKEATATSSKVDSDEEAFFKAADKPKKSGGGN